MHEMAMLERPGEERSLRRLRLESRTVIAEADDESARVELLHRLEQEMHALVLDQLPEVDDGRLVAREELLEAGRVALVGKALVRVAGIRRIAPRLVEQVREGLDTRLGGELVDVDAGRDLVNVVHVADDLLDDLADVPRPDERRLRLSERLASELLELGAP